MLPKRFAQITHVAFVDKADELPTGDPGEQSSTNPHPGRSKPEAGLSENSRKLLI